MSRTWRIDRSLGTKLAHTHDGSVDFTYLKCDPDFASIAKFHRNCLLTVVFQFVSARRYQVRIPAWLNGDPLEVSRRAHMLICAVVHQNAYNLPIFGLCECFSVSDRCQDVSSFVFIVFILIHGSRTVPSVILDDSRDLTGGVPSWWSRRRLCRSCDFVHTVLSFAFAFAFAFAFLPLLLGALPLLVSLNQQSLAMWPTRPHTKQLVFDPSVLLFPLLLPLPFFVKASISMSSGPLLLLGVTVTLPDTVRCVAGTEESLLSSLRR